MDNNEIAPSTAPQVLTLERINEIYDDMCARFTEKYRWIPFARAVEAELEAAPQQAEGWVMVPVDVLKAASESLGSFVSDHGWGDADMQAMDNLDAYLAARPSAPTAVEPAQRWPVSQDPLTQLQVAAIISDRDTPTGEQSSVVEPQDEDRYQLLRRGQHWSVIDGVGDVLRGDDLDAAIDSILAARASKGTPL